MTTNRASRPVQHNMSKINHRQQRRSGGVETQDIRPWSKKRPSLSVAIIAENEREVLPFTLTCLKPLADYLEDVVIVDGFSTDGTPEIAETFAPALPIKVYRREFDTFSAHKNYALKRCWGQWILALDADMLINSHTFLDEFGRGEFNEAMVWNFALAYARGDLRHYCRASTTDAGTTCLFRNAGLHYEGDVNEYLVMPGRMGRDSVYNAQTLRTSSRIKIVKMSMLKSDAGVREDVRRFKLWAEQNPAAGLPIETMEQRAEDLIAQRWANAEPFKRSFLRQFPQEIFDMLVPWQVLNEPAA